MNDAIITALVAKRHEVLVEHARACLEAWDIEIPGETSDFELVTELYNAEYSRRANGYDAAGNRYFELRSEDYEAIDQHNGWLEGFDAAFTIVHAAVKGELA